MKNENKQSLSQSSSAIGPYSNNFDRAMKFNQIKLDIASLCQSHNVSPKKVEDPVSQGLRPKRKSNLQIKIPSVSDKLSSARIKLH